MAVDVPGRIVQQTVDALAGATQWMSALNPTGLIPCGTGWTDYGTWPERSPKDAEDPDRTWAPAVAVAIERRAKAISYMKLPPAKSSGAILCYWPEHNLACGIAELESKGFYDCDCVPLADSWVGWIPSEFAERIDGLDVGGLLLSWVPLAWFERADLGVQVNPEQCIAWLTHDLVPGVAKALEACGHAVPREKDLEAMGLHRFEV